MISILRPRLGVLLVVASLLVAGTLAAQPADSLLLENLGRNVNSPYNDVGPVISPDGSTLYFDRTDHPQNIGNDDIWFSTLAADGTWSPAQNMGAPLNNFDHNFVSTVTPDGNTLLLGNVYYPNGTMGPGVSIVHRTRGGWDRPQKLNIRNYYSRALSANYYLANDGKTLLLAIERDDSHGDLDLYCSFLQRDGTWSEPQNLGDDVNTRGADRTPFLASDGVSLYFASDGLGGLGASDIFVTRRLDSTWRHWSKPENLGAPINSDGWDGFFTIPAAGDYAYLVSMKNTFGEADIFRVKVPGRMRPRPVLLLSGNVYDAKTKKPIAAAVAYKASTRGAENGTARTDPANGLYRVTLPAGGKYTLNVSANGYAPARTSVDVQHLNAYKENTHDFYLTPVKAAPKSNTEPGTVPILFESGSAILSESAQRELDRVVETMKGTSTLRVAVVGYTDSVGTDESNLDLAGRRSGGVAGYLISRGIEESRITSDAQGEQSPAASNGTSSGRRLNRRVELRFQ